MCADWRRLPLQIEGITGIVHIVDRQLGDACGFESAENVIQHFVEADNSLSDHLIRRAAHGGHLVHTHRGPVLHVRGFRPLLAAFGISAQWYRYDRSVLVHALSENRVAIVGVDAHQLDPHMYPRPRSRHTIVVTNHYRDRSRTYLLGFVGMDSNYPHRELGWELHSFERAVRLLDPPLMLITDRAVVRKHGAPHYAQARDGVIMPIYG